MTIQFPKFKLEGNMKAIAEKLLATKKFNNQKHLELEAMQLLVYAQAITAAGKSVASISADALSMRELKLVYMTRMENLGIIGKTPDTSAGVLKRFLSDPQGYVDQLVKDGVFTSVEEFTEQSLILIAFAFAELSKGRKMASVDEKAKVYGEWTFPLSTRMAAAPTDSSNN